MTRRDREPCRVTGCSNLQAVSARQSWAVCWTHRGRKLRTGDYAESVPVRPVTLDPEAWISYTSAHKRVELQRGHASEHACVDCGGQAQEWSYDGQAVNELAGDAKGRKWSGNPDDYSPRCINCHREFDKKEVAV